MGSPFADQTWNPPFSVSAPFLAQVLLVEPFDLGDGSDLGNHTLYHLPEGRCSLAKPRPGDV
jgi:hypothetical protein